ncbi:DUF6894 family protein [Mesorhizobium liriopis]|uniref:DUF6894 family protein n=1 Tax=Mesorhizobium liriopis TaxID=2953882 RepID=UPI003EBE0797
MRLFQCGSSRVQRYRFQITLGSSLSHAVEIDCCDDADAWEEGRQIVEDLTDTTPLTDVIVEVRNAQLKLLARISTGSVHQAPI